MKILANILQKKNSVHYLQCGKKRPNCFDSYHLHGPLLPPKQSIGMKVKGRTNSRNIKKMKKKKPKKLSTNLVRRSGSPEEKPRRKIRSPDVDLIFNGGFVCRNRSDKQNKAMSECDASDPHFLHAFFLLPFLLQRKYLQSYSHQWLWHILRATYE